MRIMGVEAMHEEAARFVRSLSPRPDGAVVVALVGDLGAGKTTFVKGAARALGVEEHVTSPTFVIEKIYHLEAQPFQKLIHIDAYRLKGAHHLKVLNWDADVRDPRNLIFVEWSEQAGEAIPEDALRISFRYSGEDERDVEYEKRA